MNQTVTVTYTLSPSGQRAALIAGRNASKTVTEPIELADTNLLDSLTIGADGSLSFDASQRYDPDWSGDPSRRLTLDAPPATLAELVEAWRVHCASVDADIVAKQAARVAREAEEQRQYEERKAHDYPIVEAILADLASLDPAADWSGVQSDYGTFRATAAGQELLGTPEQRDRLRKIFGAHSDAVQAAAKAAKAAEAAALAAQVAKDGGYRCRRCEYREADGGYRWDLAGGTMCDFRGYNLWSFGQSRRWVGIFTAPKGIASFLDSPRGEHTFDVSSLQPGDCIQGGGYDANSRGKRRNETEFFGVVVKNDDTGLVVRVCDSRTAAFAAARKVAAAQEVR